MSPCVTSHQVNVQSCRASPDQETLKRCLQVSYMLVTVARISCAAKLPACCPALCRLRQLKSIVENGDLSVSLASARSAGSSPDSVLFLVQGYIPQPACGDHRPHLHLPVDHNGCVRHSSGMLRTLSVHHMHCRMWPCWVSQLCFRLARASRRS